MTHILSFALAGVIAVGVGELAAQVPTPVGTTGTTAGTTTVGTVISATRTTLVVRATSGEYELFVLDANTTRPALIPQRATVSVAAQRPVPDQAAVATQVRVTAMPASPAPGTPPDAAQVPDEPVPASVRRLESDIQRQTRRFRIGARGGMALDPEVVMLGAHTQLGPFFHENVWARPSIEFGFGELTTLIAVNFEAAYRLPVTQESARWGLFVGAGPGLNFSKRTFNTDGGDLDNIDVDTEDQADGGGDVEPSRFSFSDLDLDVGLNFFIGMQSRAGMFMELRATAYSTPHIRFALGYNF